MGLSAGGAKVAAEGVRHVRFLDAAQHWAEKNARGECWHPPYECAIVTYPWAYYDAEWNLVPGPSPCGCNCAGCVAHRDLKAELAATEARVLDGGLRH